jgi:hypothetical protein
MIQIANNARNLAGLPPMPVPPQISAEERNAASFHREPRVTRPVDLRPGDVWVVQGGGHIRMISAVRQISLTPGSQTIEFDTAESAGSSTSSTPGPVARTWHTHNMTVFFPITKVGHTARPRGGTFHRIA